MPIVRLHEGEFLHIEVATVGSAVTRSLLGRSWCRGNEADGRPDGNFDPAGKKQMAVLDGHHRGMALREGIDELSTRDRLDRLHQAGVVDSDTNDYLHGAFEHVTNLLLRQQLEDHRLGNPICNHVPPQALSVREKIGQLIMPWIRAFSMAEI